MKLYHLSDENHDNAVFQPIRMTSDRAMYGEDCSIKRTCFSSSVQGAITALINSEYQYNIGHKFFVHIPKNPSEIVIYKPAEDEVPDCKITREYWVVNDVQLTCIGQIQLTKRIPNYYYRMWNGWRINLDKYCWKWIYKFSS